VIDYSPLVKDDMSGINMLLAAAETLDATQPLPL
jgi:hypothetical protein